MSKPLLDQDSRLWVRIILAQRHLPLETFLRYVPQLRLELSRVQVARPVQQSVHPSEFLRGGQSVDGELVAFFDLSHGQPRSREDTRRGSPPGRATRSVSLFQRLQFDPSESELRPLGSQEQQIIGKVPELRVQG